MRSGLFIRECHVPGTFSSNYRRSRPPGPVNTLHSRPASTHGPHSRSARISRRCAAHSSRVIRCGAQRFSHWPDRGLRCRGEETCGQSARCRTATVSGPRSVSTNPFGYSASQSGYPGWPSGKQSMRRRFNFHSNASRLAHGRDAIVGDAARLLTKRLCGRRHRDLQAVLVQTETPKPPTCGWPTSE